MATSLRTLVIAVATALLVVFATWQLAGWGGPETGYRVGLVGLVLSGAFATGCALSAGFRTTGQNRVASSCLAVGSAGWFTGAAANLYFHQAGPTSALAVTIFGATFLLLPLSVCAAAVLVPRGGVRYGVRLLLDGVITATSLFVVSWGVVLRDLYDVTDDARHPSVLTITHVFADVAMITIAVMFLARSRGGVRVSSLLATAGMVTISVSDAAFLYLSAAGDRTWSVIHLGWVGGMYLIGLCGLATPGAPPAHPLPDFRAPTWVSLWLPYLPVPFAVVIGANDLRTGPSPTVLLAALVIILAALTRQFLLLAENRRLIGTVAEMALRDPLTGLANRALFTDRLAHAMALRERNGTPVGVLLADLDDFKLVNDGLGHPVGDDVLRSVADRIQDSVRRGDTVARVGGDEFGILVEDTPVIVDEIAERVVRAFDEPFVIEDRLVYMRLSIGLATAAGHLDVSAEELFKRADLAMYSAKRAHVGARAFTPDMRLNVTELNLPSQPTKIGRRGGLARIQFLGDLRRAIDERELDLVYQPIFSLTTGAAVGVEALIRWPHPEFGLLEPADFLPLVRENGLMEVVTDLVLDRAVEDATGWQAAGIDLPVAINLSAPSLNDEELPARVSATLAARGMSPSSLTVEITEDLLMSSVVRARTVLDRLRESGVRVAIDDFGSGYAAMTYLHELPVDELKLDRQFIAPILHDERAAAIVRSVLELARDFGLTSVAEGIENEATAELLKSFGCGFAQGHYFSPPVPAQAIRLGVGIQPHATSPVTPSEATRPSLA
ncbi:putative bifunctional diguanylate cyclase/phosphodiesterase [Mycobacterium antarcticum]|uniref:putative bifunctional diguanylate cyclase/phosphodiesterase n=1 Tax=Mycolicibacterium sp. TUM20984 TaxID=3023368 RepID=UPI0023A36B28|nr:GGDEF domain-containing phosphodiesterase [Mycolicibacterium sp. TUM20984]GLP78949.1 GGDEF-domain containing protein [Mycolicibacterium sp. TUM20984]